MTLRDRILLTAWLMGPIRTCDLHFVMLLCGRSIARFCFIRALAWLESDVYTETVERRLVVTPRGEARCRYLLSVQEATDDMETLLRIRK